MVRTCASPVRWRTAPASGRATSCVTCGWRVTRGPRACSRGTSRRCLTASTCDGCLRDENRLNPIGGQRIILAQTHIVDQELERAWRPARNERDAHEVARIDTVERRERQHDFLPLARCREGLRCRHATLTARESHHRERASLLRAREESKLFL